MNSFSQRFKTTGIVSQLRNARRFDEEDSDLSEAAWGSQAGFGNLARGSLSFVVPNVADVSV